MYRNVHRILLKGKIEEILSIHRNVPDWGLFLQEFAPLGSKFFQNLSLFNLNLLQC